MKKILIVEDDVAITRVISAYLQKENYEIVIVQDGEQAIEMYESIQPSLILLDIMIPGIDGWGVLSYIREKNACPVIMLTALSKTDQMLSGLNLGADDYITKPFVTAEVVARVNAVLRRSLSVLEKRA